MKKSITEAILGVFFLAFLVGAVPPSSVAEIVEISVPWLICSHARLISSVRLLSVLTGILLCEWALFFPPTLSC
jgi:hypothetical protein